MLKFISADDHLLEPEDMWLTRLPSKLRANAPQWTRNETGGAVLLLEGKPRPPQTRTIQFVKGNEERIESGEFLVSERYRHALLPSETLDIHHDPGARAALLRETGLIGTVNFPCIPRFSGTLFLECEDRTLADLCVRAWNDWLFEEWCAADPELYIPMTIVQLWDVELAAQEIRRNAARGGRAVSFPEDPAPLGLPSFYTDHWDPMWTALEETGTVVCMHLGSRGSVATMKDAPKVVDTILAEQNSVSCLVNLLFSPVPERFPGLKFVLSESGLAWVPGLLDRCDREWEEYRRWSDLGPVRPSEIYARSFYGCTVGEPMALHMRDFIGVDTMLWECDFPHAESPWPHHAELMEKIGSGVPLEELEAITFRNAAALFRWDCP